MRVKDAVVLYTSVHGDSPKYISVSNLGLSKLKTSNEYFESIGDFSLVGEVFGVTFNGVYGMLPIILDQNLTELEARLSNLVSKSLGLDYKEIRFDIAI